MKVDTLLAQYLYKHKRLSLSGIGIFTLADTPVILDDPNNNIKQPIQGVSFQTKTSAPLDDSLVEFIKMETGKMKALAEADLTSYITQAHQFLNIGKAFYFEGIGTLQKNTDASFSFNPGDIIPIKIEEKDDKQRDIKKKSAFAVEEVNFAKEAINSNKLILAGIIAGTLALIGLGGYYLYNKNTTIEPAVVIENNIKVVPETDINRSLSRDTNTGAFIKDSVSAIPQKPIVIPAPIATTTGFKFILETTEKKLRALKRYNQIKQLNILKSYASKIQIETQDSIRFKIFTIIPCEPADTIIYKDSLNIWYYGSGAMRIKIEY